MATDYDWDEFFAGVDAQNEQKIPMNASHMERIVSFSPEMVTYRKEFRGIMKRLGFIGAKGTILSNTLLLSIDDGWGYNEFFEMLIKELKQGLDLSFADIEIKEESFPGNNNYAVWENQIDRVKNLSAKAGKSGKFAVVVYDFAEAVEHLGEKETKKFLSAYRREAKEVFLIFRLPYMERSVLEQYERALSDVMSVHLLCVPPISIENMVVYLKDRIQRTGMKVKANCEDLLEQWICQEKSDGTFLGYETLDKMASELIYDKALNIKDGQEAQMKSLLPSDIHKQLEHVMEQEDAYELLNELIGMAELKVRISELIAQLKFQKKLHDMGKEIDPPSLHMMFLGNPGTGKTTVARIIGKIFKQEGLLRKGHFIEMRGSDFVLTKIGETVAKVRSACQDAYGSILFIDEAYGMSIGYSGGNTVDEILPTMVSEMEDHRDDLCVIFAGYEDEMGEFLAQNSGLKSRIPNVLKFPNYSRDELIEIFHLMGKGKFQYEEALKETFREYIYSIPEEAFDSKEFSNARFIRNIFERLWGKAAYRMSQSGETELVLKKSDMLAVIEERDYQEMLKKKGKKAIGFTTV